MHFVSFSDYHLIQTKNSAVLKGKNSHPALCLILGADVLGSRSSKAISCYCVSNCVYICLSETTSLGLMPCLCPSQKCRGTWQALRCGTYRVPVGIHVLQINLILSRCCAIFLQFWIPSWLEYVLGSLQDVRQKYLTVVCHCDCCFGVFQNYAYWLNSTATLQSCCLCQIIYTHLDHLNFFVDMKCLKIKDWSSYTMLNIIDLKEALHLVDSQQSKPMPVSLNMTHSLCLLSKWQGPPGKDGNEVELYICIFVTYTHILNFESTTSLNSKWWCINEGDFTYWLLCYIFKYIFPTGTKGATWHAGNMPVCVYKQMWIT